MFYLVAKFIIIYSLISVTIFGSEKIVLNSDTMHIVKDYNQDKYKNSFDSLNAIYGKYKQLPDGYEIQALLALSHYPELKEIRIDFIYRKAMIPLSSRPRLLSTFRKKEKWRYKVVISSESLDAMENILVKNLPLNSQIGIIGHELAHSVYYQNQNFFQIIGIGIMYFFPKFRAKFERDTDIRTIDYGLGWQLLEYAAYVRNINDLSNSNFDMDKYYLNPQEIEEYMNQLHIYN